MRLLIAFLSLFACFHEAGAGPHVDRAPLPAEVTDRVKAEIKQAPRSVVGRHLERAFDRLESRLSEHERGGASVRQGGMPVTSMSGELKVLRDEAHRAIREKQSDLRRSGLHEKATQLEGLRRNVDDRFSRLERAIERFGRAQGRTPAAQAQELRKVLEGMREPTAALGPVPTFTTAAPVRPAEQLRSPVVPKYMSWQREPALYASAGDEVVAILDPIPPTSDCGQTAGDLDKTSIDAKVTPEIAALAKTLDYSAVKIVDYVTNEIAFEPYWGSLKGAQGTLHSKGGGPTDQASLLVALLREANIPARYVRGTVDILDPRGPRWVGAKTFRAAADMLGLGGNPNAGTITDATSAVVGMAFAHVWVEACVPYANYRGTRSDTTGYRWIPLDPSFKDKSYQPGIAHNVVFDYTGHMARRTNDLPAEAYADQVEAAVKAVGPNFSNNTAQDVAYKGTRIRRQFDVLPSSLPYRVRSFDAWGVGLTAETALLPAGHRYQLTIAPSNTSGTALLSPVTLAMPEVTLQRITLGWRGATPADQTALDAWKNQSLSSEISCGINVVPEIRTDGVVVATGSVAVGLCTTSNRLNMRVSVDDASYPAHPLVVNQVEFTTIGAANLHALQAYAYQASDRLLEERSARLLAAVRANPGANTSTDEVVGEFLHLTGLKYVRYVADAWKNIGALDGGSGESGHHLGLTSSQMRVEYLFDLPFGVHRTGYLVDFPGGQSRSVDLSTGRPVWKTFLLSGYAGSALESYVWQENAKMDAVSTVRGIQYARENGIEVLVLNAANWASENGKLTSNTNSALNYTPADVASLNTNYISTGHTLTIPRSVIQYGDWKGAVYVAEKDGTSHPTAPTATASFVIQKYAGGYTIGDMFFLAYNSSLDSSWAITGLPSNFYESEFEALSTVSSMIGNGFTPSMSFAGDPVNMVTGNMYHVERDISIKGRGLPIMLERSYNSRAPRDGPFGFGWTHSFNHYLTFLDDNLDGASNTADSDGMTSSVAWAEGTGGERFISISGATGGGVSASAIFTAPRGFFFQISRQANGTYRVREKNGLTYTFESAAGTVGQKAKLIRIADRYGNGLDLAYTGQNLATVTDSVGRSLNFTYNGSNRIVEVRDWTARRFQYVYDGSGNLTSFKNPLAVAGRQPPMLYEYYVDTSVDSAGRPSPVNRAMKKYTLPRGNGMTFEYYTNGRVFRHFNTLGETSTFTYNDFRRESVHVNERGHTRRFFFDPNGNPVKIVDENGAEREYTYDCAEPGNLANCANPYNRLSKREPLGYTTGYQYDAQGNVTRITLPSGNAVELSHFDGFSQPGKVKDARGSYALHKYDSQGNVLQIIKLKSGFGAGLDPATYVPVASQIVAWTINTYDTFGNLLSSKRVKDFATQAGPTLSYTYDSQGLNATGITRNGVLGTGSTGSESATFAYDPLGRMTSGVRNDWYPIERSYDDVDRVVQATDDVNNRRNYLYDANGNVLGDQIVTAGAIVDNRSYTYDLSDRRVQSMNSGGYATTFEFDAAGNVVRTTNPDGYTASIEYDSANRLVQARNERGDTVARELDLDGKVRSTTDPNGNTVTNSYFGPEREGRLKRIAQPAVAGYTSGRALEYDYDAGGNVIKVLQVPATPASGSPAAAREALSFYDELSRLVRNVGPTYVDPAPSSPTFNQTIRPVTSYQYDNLGNLVQVAAGRADSSGTNAATDVLTVQMTYTYDDFGRQLTRTNAINKAWTYRYDTFGNVVQSTDPRGQALHYTYLYGGRLQCLNKDAANPPCGMGANRLKSYVRNPLGLVTQASSPEVTYTYAYDAARRLITAVDSRGPKTLTYAWSNGGRLNKLTNGEGGQTDYLYDPVGRLMGIWSPTNDYISFKWDAGGRLAEKWFPNGINTQYLHNADNSVQQIRNRVFYDDTATISQHDYTYDGFGSRVRNRERVFQDQASPFYQALRDYRYTYDSLNRLTEVFETNGGTEGLVNRYHYDVLGNRTHEIYPDGYYFRYSHNAANQETGWDLYDGSNQPAGYTGVRGYDNAGNQTTRMSKDNFFVENTYDSLNRLTQVTQVDNGSPLLTQTYAYDDQGRRVRKTHADGAGGYTSHFLYDGQDINALYLASGGWGAPQATLTHGPMVDDPLVVRYSGGTVNYFHGDALGSIVMTTTKSVEGTYQISELMRYDAWGNLTPGPDGFVNMFSYTGRERDETGLMYYRARYYNPGMGRFIQADPIGYTGGQINLYAYVGNSPTNLTDPSGLIAKAASKLFNPNSNNWLQDYTSGGDGAGTFTSGSQTLQVVSQNDRGTQVAGLGVLALGAITLGGVYVVGSAIQQNSNQGEDAHGTAGSLGGLIGGGPQGGDPCGVFTGLCNFFGGFGSAEQGGAQRGSSGPGNDHIVLGIRSQGLEKTAESVGGRTLLSDPNWRSTLQHGLRDSGTRFTVSLDGFSGEGTYNQVMGAVQRGAGAAPAYTEWEMTQIFRANRLGDVYFMRGGQFLQNPFR